MSQGERWENGFDDGRPSAPKQGMGTGLKVLLILLVGGGICGLICCGGMMYFGSQAVKVAQTPQDAQAIADEIAALTIPEKLGLPPQFGMRRNLGFMSMKMAFFGDVSPANANQPGANQNASRLMILAEMKFPDSGQGDAEAQMRQAMRQQNQGGRDLNIAESQSREYEIRGKKATFKFEKGTDPNDQKTYHQVTGFFPGKAAGSMGMLSLQIKEESYDEEAVEEMIKSIK